MIQKGMDQASAREALSKTLEGLGSIADFEHGPLEELLRGMGEELGLSARQFFSLLRVAVTGLNATPPLFETMEVLGRERVLSRVRDASARLDGLNGAGGGGQ